MSRTWVIESLESLVTSLEEAIDELSHLISVLGGLPPEPAVNLWDDQRSFNNGGNQSDRQAWIAKRLREYWSGVSMGSEMAVGSLTVDLSSAQGRWELLVLAVLRGARVRERSVEDTFTALAERGLTDLERLAAAEPKTEAELSDVFATHYRALTSRQAKVEALMANANLLKSEYDGDLHNLYLAHKDNPEAIIKALQRFKQVGQVAYWICRTLKVHGIWPDLGPEATQYLDRHTDLPLERLGVRAPFDEQRPGSTTTRFAAAHLAGDTVPLYLQGLLLCSKEDVSTCRFECALAPECRYWRKAE